MRDDACDLLDDAGSRVDAGRPQSRRQQMTTTEYVQRKVAVAVVKTVIEPAFLVAMQGHVGGVRIEDDDLRRRRVRLQEHIDEQPVDRGTIVADLVIAAGRARLAFRWRMLEPVERALAGERGAALVAHRQLAHHRGEKRIVAQLVVVVDIGIAERLAEDPLTDQRDDAVLDPIGIALVRECSCEALDQADRLVGGAEQQRATVRRDLPAVERGHDRAPLDASEIERIRSTVCRHRAIYPSRLKSLSQNNFC